jgi:voltage-gated potassium channel
LVPRNSFYTLFAGLIVLLLVEPFLEGAPKSQSLIQLAFAGMMVVGVFGLSPDRRVFLLGVALALIGLATAVGFHYTDAVTLQLIDLVAIAAFCALAITVNLHRVVLSPGPINADRIVGALCIYLLIGVLWAILYSLIEVFEPTAFVLAGGHPKEPLEHFLYYSFVTLTTIGYGDMTPLHPVARTVAYLEAVVGQLYIAVLIAGLVGRRTTEAGARSTSSSQKAPQTSTPQEPGEYQMADV